MSKHALSSYLIQVRRIRETDHWQPLSNFDGNGTDMLKVITGYLAHLAEQNYDNPQGERSLKAEKPTVDGRYIKVTMHSGEYGVQSMFSDKYSGEQVFERQNIHVEETPIRNLFFIPRGFQAGLLLTERYQTTGVMTNLSKSLKSAFRSVYRDFMLEINNVSPASALETLFKEGDLKKIRLSKTCVPDDIADLFELSNYQKEAGTVEFVVRAPRQSTLSKKSLERVVRKQASVDGLLSWNGVDFEALELDVAIGTSSRKLSVTGGTMPNMVYVLDERRQGDNSRLDEAILYERAAEIARDLAKSLGMDASHLKDNFVWPKDWDDYRLEVPQSGEDGER